MKTIGKYLKQQKASALICFCLILLQSCCALIIPQLTSDLINTGVQQKGIQSCVPEKITIEGMELVKFILPEAEEVEFLSHYTFSDGIYSLIPEKETEKLHELFYNAAATGVTIAMDKAGNTISGLSAKSINVFAELGDIDDIYNILNALSTYNESDIKSIYSTASETPLAVKKQYAAVLIPYFYEDAGIDCESLQNEYIIKHGIILIIFTLLQIIFIIFTFKISSEISENITTALRKDFLTRTANLTLEKRNTLKHDLFTVFSHDINNAGLIIKYTFNQFIFAPIISIGSIICSFIISPSLSLIVIATVIITILALYLIVRKSIPVYEIMQKTYLKLAGIFKINIRQLYTIRSLRTQHIERSKILSLSEDLKKQERYILRAVFVGLTIVSLISNIVITLSILPLGENLLSSVLGIGDFIAFLQYSSITVSAFTTIAAVILFAPRAKVSIDNIAHIFDVSKVSESDIPTKELQKNCSHKVEFKDVTLKAADSKQLRNISFIAEKGKITAITGPTGCGKTCLLQTLIGNGKKESGSILLDSEEIETIIADSLRARISYGFSNPQLFSASVRDNLVMYGADDYKAIEEALDIAMVDFIDDTETFLENAASHFSGGQRARLALAGVLSKKAGIYIIDDCLKSLDINTESRILSSLEKLKLSSTIIIVSQRINTLARADKIIVLDNGTISSQGTHEELLQTSDYYKSLAALQEEGGVKYE